MEWNCLMNGITPRKISKKYYLMFSYALPILNIEMPHVGHVPLVAGLPFFMVTA